MRIPKNTIDEISDKSDIVEVVSDYVRLERRGSRYVGLCPFHSEKTPSFSVSPENNLFYCFGCHKGGNVFTFVMEIEHLSFVEAAKHLAEKAGVHLDLTQQGEGSRETDALEELYERTAKMFHYFFASTEEGERARRYTEERAIDRQTAELFGFGFSPTDRKWLYRFLRKKNYSAEFLARSGLFSRRYPEITLFSGRLIFPIRSAGGKVIAFGGRSLDGSEPKYLNSPETELYQKRNALFGLFEGGKEIRKKREVLIVEGYFDAIAFYQAGIARAVAPLGTSLTDDQAKILKRYADRALLIFDGDEAGQAAALKAIEICEKIGLETAVVKPESSKDPAEILTNEGAETLNKMLKYTINNFEFLVDTALARFGDKGAEEKSHVVSAVSRFLHNVDSEVRRQEYYHRLAARLDITPDAVQRDLDRTADNTVFRRKGQDVEPEENERIGADLFLMLATAAHYEFYPYVRRQLQYKDIRDKRAMDVFIALEESFRQEESDINSICSRIENEGLRDLLMQKAVSEEFSINTEAMIKDTVRLIKKKSLEERGRDLRKRLKRLVNEGSDSEKQRELLSEKMYIDEELERLKVVHNDRD